MDHAKFKGLAEHQSMSIIRITQVNMEQKSQSLQKTKHDIPQRKTQTETNTKTQTNKVDQTTPNKNTKKLTKKFLSPFFNPI